MKQLALVLLVAGGFVFSVGAQAPTAIRSFSGQFIAHEPRGNGPVVMPPDLLTNGNSLELKPELLAVSAERIKQSIWLELGANATWRDNVHFTLRPARSAADLVNVRLERFRSSWNYRVDLPNVMERQKFVHALVSVILLEVANRTATDRSAEVPAWLTQGMTERLLETRGKQLMLPPPRTLPGGMIYTPTVNEVRRDDPMRVVRQELKETSALTIAELSWPTDAQLNGQDQGRYRRTAGLFVTELQQLHAGRASLRSMVGNLGACYNWQTAFYQAFTNTFPRPLELEKWWALQVAHLNGRDPDRLWNTEDSLRKLDELLKVSVSIRQTSGELPASGLASLQNVIQEWDALRQVPVLQKKLAELDSARLRVSNDVARILDEYRMTLAGYLNKRSAPGAAFFAGRNSPPGARQLTRETVRALNELDRRRAELQTAENTGLSTTQL